MKKPPVARKLAVGHLCPTASILATSLSSFNYFKMHAWSSSMLHSTFMVSVSKLLLNGVVGVCELYSHGNYIVDHGKIMELCFEFLWETWLCAWF